MQYVFNDISAFIAQERDELYIYINKQKHRHEQVKSQIKQVKKLLKLHVVPNRYMYILNKYNFDALGVATCTYAWFLATNIFKMVFLSQNWSYKKKRPI